VQRCVRDDVAGHEDHQHRLPVGVLMMARHDQQRLTFHQQGGIMRISKALTLLVLLPTAAVSTACSDFLGLEPPQSVSDAVYFQTLDDFRAAIVGRSEERRVGKGWRDGRCAERYERGTERDED